MIHLTGRLERTRILLVDDNEDSRRLMSLILKREGATVDLANSMAEALARLRVERLYHVMATDIVLADGDGFLLVQSLRALELRQRSRGRLPVVAISGHQAADVRNSDPGSEFHACLTKPVENAVLVATLAEAASSTIH